MRILVSVLVALLALGAASAGSIFGYKALSSNSEPDRVVAVLAKCSLVAQGKTLDLTGSECEHGDRVGHTDSGISYTIFNSRLQLSVRTPQGSGYVVEVPFRADVSVGDPWPK